MPEGFRYQPEFLTELEEQELTQALAQLPLKPFEFHGHLGNRRVVSFGLRYNYSRRGVEAAAQPPRFLDELRHKIASFAGRAPANFRQIGINEYRPGAGIGWHRDKFEFGDVVGISLLAPATMRLRRRSGDSWDRASHIVEPRSIYIFSGEAREEWEHSIPPVDALRYSITYRTLASSIGERS